jgi:hypothetical protein
MYNDQTLSENPCMWLDETHMLTTCLMRHTYLGIYEPTVTCTHAYTHIHTRSMHTHTKHTNAHETHAHKHTHSPTICFTGRKRDSSERRAATRDFFWLQLHYTRWVWKSYSQDGCGFLWTGFVMLTWPWHKPSLDFACWCKCSQCYWFWCCCGTDRRCRFTAWLALINDHIST